MSSNSLITVSLLTPQKALVEKFQTDELIAPGVEGELEIYPDHANFLTELNTGVLKWKADGQWKTAAMSFGWLEVFDNQVTVLADVAELSGSIDQERAKGAEKRAREILEKGGVEPEAFGKHELKLKRAMARQQAN